MAQVAHRGSGATVEADRLTARDRHMGMPIARTGRMDVTLPDHFHHQRSTNMRVTSSIILASAALALSACSSRNNNAADTTGAMGAAGATTAGAAGTAGNMGATAGTTTGAMSSGMDSTRMRADSMRNRMDSTGHARMDSTRARTRRP